MSKPITLIFMGSEDGTEAKALAGDIRKNAGQAHLASATMFTPAQTDSNVSHVVIMPCVGVSEARKIREAYGDKVKTAAVAIIPPPPGAPLPNPLANLPASWRTSLDTVELRRLAEVVSGRAVQNKAEAVKVIEEKLSTTK